MPHGTLCFCVDFKCLNTQTKKDLYPLSCIQEALESMLGSAHFSSMNFKSGFWQIKMAPELQQYMAFMVGNLSFYKFTHMLFKLCNAPVTFQRLMQNMLDKLNVAYCVIYWMMSSFLATQRRSTWSASAWCSKGSAQAFKVLIFPVRNHLPGSSCLVMGHPAEP